MSFGLTHFCSRKLRCCQGLWLLCCCPCLAVLTHHFCCQVIHSASVSFSSESKGGHRSGSYPSGEDLNPSAVRACHRWNFEGSWLHLPLICRNPEASQAYPHRQCSDYWFYFSDKKGHLLPIHSALQYLQVRPILSPLYIDVFL